jgi:hypothetical protein
MPCPVGQVYFRSKHTCVGKRTAIARKIYHYPRHVAAKAGEAAIVHHRLRRARAATSAPSIPLPPIRLVGTGTVSAPAQNETVASGARSVLTDPMNHIGLEIRQLNPPDQLHEKLAADCFDQFKDVVRARWSIIEEPYSSIAKPFLRMLVFWLMVIFACFGLRAPASPLVLIVIALSAISLSSTMFIILDMDMPYEGLFKISSQTMRTALSDMLR